MCKLVKVLQQAWWPSSSGLSDLASSHCVESSGRTLYLAKGLASYTRRSRNTAS